MKSLIAILTGAILAVSCGNEVSETTQKESDSMIIPDSVPQMVRLGKEANWAYKPDTMVNELLLGDANSFTTFKKDNGNVGRTKDNLMELTYVNAGETEQLAVFVIGKGKSQIPYAFRLKKNLRDKNSPPAENYATTEHFITSSGIYLGMSTEYVQTIYKSQPMMKWVKNDTTYLGYAPGDKDKEHYKRYSHLLYSATYKFVNDRCVMLEMNVDPEAFEQQ